MHHTCKIDWQRFVPQCLTDQHRLTTSATCMAGISSIGAPIIMSEHDEQVVHLVIELNATLAKCCWTSKNNIEPADFLMCIPKSSSQPTRSTLCRWPTSAFRRSEPAPQGLHLCLRSVSGRPAPNRERKNNEGLSPDRGGHFDLISTKNNEK